MRNRNPTYITGNTRRWLWPGGLVFLLCLLLPGTVLASAPDPDYAGPETCAQCHTSEAAAWEDSPHGHAEFAADHTGVTCEECHGAYVVGHPQQGLMQLPADGSCCQDCHTTTYQEWHETQHAASGVQCTSCHVPHTQDNRLPEEDLCASCHRDEAEHWVHHNAGVHCVDCHMMPHSDTDESAVVNVVGPGTAPDHGLDYAVHSCVECHQEGMHAGEIMAADADYAQLPVMIERAQQLAGDLESAQRANRTLQTMSVVSLGFGLGIGGVLGAIFVTVVGFIAQRRTER
jgi:predicted CXXCH cytochrome family protein